MDDARKLLDSLMGSSRNLERKEALRKKGNNFKEDNICKYYLIGFCPQHEALFHSTKRDIGDCKKVHSDAMKEEFETHADHAEYRGKYESKLKQYLEELIRGADEWTARERRNIQDANRLLEEQGPNEVAKAEIQKMSDNSAALLHEAEEWAEKGNIEESKKKVEMAAEIKKRAQDWEEKAKTAGLRSNDDVCEVCGSRMESGDGSYAKFGRGDRQSGPSGFKHKEGKVHIGYVKIREWLADVRKRVRDREEAEEARRAGRGSRRRERSRSRDGGRDDGRERRKEREPQEGRPQPDERGGPPQASPAPSGGCERESRGDRDATPPPPPRTTEQRELPPLAEQRDEPLEAGGAQQERSRRRDREDFLSDDQQDYGRPRRGERRTQDDYRDLDQGSRGPTRGGRREEASQGRNGRRERDRDRDGGRDGGREREGRGSRRHGSREDYGRY